MTAILGKGTRMGSKKNRKNKTRITAKELGRQKFLLIWSAVFVVYGFVFYYLPLGGWIMAFQNYKNKTGFLHSQWVGLDKFKFLFSDVTFLRVIRNTFCMGVMNLVFTTLMAIFFAIVLNEVRLLHAKKVIQTVSYLPHFLSWIIVTGILNDALSSIGQKRAGMEKNGIVSSIRPAFFRSSIASAALSAVLYAPSLPMKKRISAFSGRPFKAALRTSGISFVP